MENNDLITEIQALKETVHDLSVLIVARLNQPPAEYKKSSKISVRQAAEKAGVSVNTVHNWIKQRKITGYDYGGKVVVEEKVLNKFLEDSKIESVSDVMQRAVNGGGFNFIARKKP